MKYCVKKKFTFDYAHRLELPYESQCTNIHGHTGVLIVKIKSEYLNSEGMVIDFTHLKKILKPHIDNFDHAFIMSDTSRKLESCLKDYKTVIFPYHNSTAECFAEFFYHKVKAAFPDKEVQIEFFETPDNSATFGDW